MTPVLMTFADAMDRYTIVLRSREHGNEKAEEELVYLTACLDTKWTRELIRLCLTLMSVNSDIWNLEASIRAGTLGEENLEEVGRRALLIRKFNARRVDIKRQIAQLCGQPHTPKVEHASAVQQSSSPVSA